MLLILYVCAETLVITHLATRTGHLGSSSAWAHLFGSPAASCSLHLPLRPAKDESKRKEYSDWTSGQ